MTELKFKRHFYAEYALSGIWGKPLALRGDEGDDKEIVRAIILVHRSQSIALPGCKLAWYGPDEFVPFERAVRWVARGLFLEPRIPEWNDEYAVRLMAQGLAYYRSKPRSPFTSPIDMKESYVETVLAELLAL